MSCNWVWTSLWMLSNLPLLYWKKDVWQEEQSKSFHALHQFRQLVGQVAPRYDYDIECVLFCFVIFNESESYIKESTRSYPSNRPILPKKREKLAHKGRKVHITLEKIRECLIYFPCTRLYTFFPQFWSGLDEICDTYAFKYNTGSPPIQSDSVFCNELSMSHVCLSLSWVHDTYVELGC